MECHISVPNIYGMPYYLCRTYMGCHTICAEQIWGAIFVSNIYMGCHICAEHIWGAIFVLNINGVPYLCRTYMGCHTICAEHIWDAILFVPNIYGVPYLCRTYIWGATFVPNLYRVSYVCQTNIYCVPYLCRTYIRVTYYVCHWFSLIIWTIWQTKTTNDDWWNKGRTDDRQARSNKGRTDDRQARSNKGRTDDRQARSINKLTNRPTGSHHLSKPLNIRFGFYFPKSRYVYMPIKLWLDDRPIYGAP